MEKLEVLKRCAAVKDLDEKQLQVLADLATSETFQVGETLGRQGRTAEKVYIIEDGLVGIYLELGPMTHRQIQSAASFELVGWSAMLPPYRMYTTVMAIETTRVLSFEGKALSKLCQTHPPIGCKVHRGMAATIASRLNNAYVQLMGVSSSD
jgi:CRP-like cAMP-binding protein